MAGKNRKLIVDTEFKGLMIPQSKLERDLLEAEMTRDGRCRDKLVVWKEEGRILDGHNRYEISEKHDLPYDIEEISLPDRDAARAWIRTNQMSRRNLTPEAASYLRGQHYNDVKKAHGGDRKSQESNGDANPVKSDEQLATQYQVASKTIRNDGKFVEFLDSITVNCGDDFKNVLLRREVKVTRGQVKKLSKMTKVTQKKIIAEVMKSGKWPNDVDGTGNAKERKRDEKNKLTVPTAPQELVKSLLKLKGASYLEKIKQNLEAVLKEHAEKNKEEK